MCVIGFEDGCTCPINWLTADRFQDNPVPLPVKQVRIPPAPRKNGKRKVRCGSFVPRKLNFDTADEQLTVELLHYWKKARAGERAAERAAEVVDSPMPALPLVIPDEVPSSVEVIDLTCDEVDVIDLTRERPSWLRQQSVVYYGGDH